MVSYHLSHFVWWLAFSLCMFAKVTGSAVQITHLGPTHLPSLNTHLASRFPHDDEAPGTPHTRVRGSLGSWSTRRVSGLKRDLLSVCWCPNGSGAFSQRSCYHPHTPWRGCPIWYSPVSPDARIPLHTDSQGVWRIVPSESHPFSSVEPFLSRGAKVTARCAGSGACIRRVQGEPPSFGLRHSRLGEAPWKPVQPHCPSCLSPPGASAGTAN